MKFQDYLIEHTISAESIMKFGLTGNDIRLNIPIKDANGKLAFMKSREFTGKKKFHIPGGTKTILFNSSILKNNPEYVIVAAGEPDAIRLDQEGLLAVSSTAGEGTWKSEWTKHVKGVPEIILGLDNDEKGIEATKKLFLEFPKAKAIEFPIGIKDVCEFFKTHTKADFLELVKGALTEEEFLAKHPEKDKNQAQNNSESEWGPNTHTEKIYSEYEWGSISYSEWGIPEILEVLGKTIKKDDSNKVLVFLCQLLAYTHDSQINLSFNSPSSAGKSYLALEIAEFFPKEDVMELGYASPTSFFHTSSEFDEDKNAFIVDLERKIVIFLDMPHAQLLEHLRPVLSHDRKEVLIKVTDKNRRGGIKTKDIILRGYPAVLFCTASFKLDEQELTRFILLSPETTQAKLKHAVDEKVKKETSSSQYMRELAEDPKRKELKERVAEIKKVNAQEIRLGTSEKLLQLFYKRNTILKPRSSRDIQKISSLIKGFALLNCWNRERTDGVIVTNENDLNNAFKVWDEISLAQELGVAPYILSLYKEIIVPAFEEKNKMGVSRLEITKKHHQVYGRHLPDWQLRQEIIPMLETSGLVAQEPDPMDKRRILVWPQVLLTISQTPNNEELNGEITENEFTQTELSYTEEAKE